MSEQDVLLEVAGGLATITLNRPDKANALSFAVRTALDQRLREAARNTDVRVVLIVGAGDVFCGGIDLNDLPDDPLVWRERVLGAQSNHLAVVRMPKVVIAAVQGPVVGGGASLALSADILVMADNAYLAFPFVRLGLVPDGGSSYFLQAKLGVAVAHDLLLTGEKLPASQAAQLGLTRRIVPVAELRTAAQKLAEELLRLPQESLMLTKALCRQYWGAQLDSALAHEADAFGLATVTEGHLQAKAKLRRR